MATKKIKQNVTKEFLDHQKPFELNNYNLTAKQREIVKLCRDKNTKILFLDGPAGSSKSFISTFVALTLIRDGSKQTFKYIRSLVESSQSKCGFLPGDLNHKLSPYEGPLRDKLAELLSPYDINKLFLDGRIECLPTNFIRGLTFSDSVVFVDESQNNCFADLVSILTRIGENTLMIFGGDTMQCDIKNSGFERMFNLFDGGDCVEQGIFTYKFTEDDIMRSEILKFIMKKLKSK